VGGLWTLDFDQDPSSYFSLATGLKREENLSESDPDKTPNCGVTVQSLFQQAKRNDGKNYRPYLSILTVKI